MRQPRIVATRVDALMDVKRGMEAALDAEKRTLAESGKVSRRVARNGRLKVFMNGSYVYSFELDRSWEPAEDTFVRVSLNDADPRTASISVSGLTVSAASPESDHAGRELTLEAESKHPEIEMRRIRVETDPAFLLDRLKDAVRDADEGDRRLASKAFGLLRISEPSSASVETRDYALGASQQHALTMALTHEVVYVIGPPGTGKTRTLAAMALEFARRGLSVLITAQTNIAVDNAIEQLARLSTENSSTQRDVLSVGTVARYGRPHVQSVRRLEGVYLPLAATRSLLAQTRADLAEIAAKISVARAEQDSWTRRALDAATDLARFAAAAKGKGRRPAFLRLFAGPTKDELIAERDAQNRARIEAERQVEGLAQTIAVLATSHHELLERLHALERHEAALLRESPETFTNEASLGGAAGEGLSADLEREVYYEEMRLLREAQIVGATLTKTYVAKGLQQRRFDVVIADEASMASLPALYVAAARAKEHLVLIGDPRQLPPIVGSRDYLASEWLGKDVFSKARVGLTNTGDATHSVLLDEQRRMHPDISRIARRHVYEGLLRDHASMAGAPRAIRPFADKALVLCDTSDADPKCVRPLTSRINVYHAICTFMLGWQALEDLGRVSPPDANGERRPRVGLITPYQKQAELLQGLIEAVGLESDMRAGTVHRFQGLECEVVVFDTVESPDLPPAPFTRGGAGSEAQRLINVAVTRARQKLILVANRAYLERFLAEDSSVPGGHTLWKAICEATESAILPSSEVVGFDVPERLAQLADLLRPLTGAEFDKALARDLAKARERVLVVSPYVTPSRTNKLLALLQPALGRGVRVRALSRPPSAARDARVSIEAVEQLRASGVICESRPAVHQKVVVIDDTVAYVGSLNPLSYGGATRELMVRIPSAQFVALLLKQLVLD